MSRGMALPAAHGPGLLPAVFFAWIQHHTWCFHVVISFNCSGLQWFKEGLNCLCAMLQG